tara:strand:+ start:3274 stop:5802 length:2529 start_codon:yes stop_codon:yes gene_type:complete
MAGYIGVQPVPKATQRREYFTAGNNQTTFNTSGYTPDYVDVYMNGVKLSPADFTATNGSDVVLASGAATGDLLQIISFLPFQAANQAFTGTFSVTGAVDFDSTLTTNGNITINTGNSGVPAINLSHSNANADNFQLTAGIPGVANSGFSIRDVDESANRLAIDTSGNVGIAMTPDSAVKLSVSGAIGPTNGSNSAPTHTFYSDPDTGMYRSGANALSFATGGTAALTINSSQNATFAGTVTSSSSITATTTINVGTGGGFYLKQDSSESTIRSESQPIVLQTFASGAWQDRLTIANNGDVDSATFFRAPNFYTGTGSQAFKANGNDINIVSQAGATQMILKNDGCTTIQTGTSNVADEFIFAKFYCSVSPGNAAGILLGGYPADGYAKQGIFIDRYLGFPGNSGRGDLLLVNKDSTSTDTPTSADTKVRITPVGDVIITGTSSQKTSLMTYDDNSTKLTVYNGDGSARSGYLELGAAANVNGYNAGAIQFINNNNSDSTTTDTAGTTCVGQIRTVIKTTDSNAGDDSGGTIQFWTKQEGEKLHNTARLEHPNAYHRVDFVVTAEGLPGDSGINANSFFRSIAKGNYYTGLEISSTSGHVGGWIGHWNGSATARGLQARVAGNGLNASDILAMKVEADGKIKVGRNSDSISGDPVFTVERNATDHDSAIRTIVNGTSSRYAIDFHNGNGSQGNITVNSGSVSYNSTSDYRLKENVTTSWDGTSRLKQLKPSRFNFKTDTDKTIDGFLAHEVSSIVPEAVVGEKDATKVLQKVILAEDGSVVNNNIEEDDWKHGKETEVYDSKTTWVATKEVPVYQSLDPAKLVPLLVKTIQELEARITALEAK